MRGPATSGAVLLLGLVLLFQGLGMFADSAIADATIPTHEDETLTAEDVTTVAIAVLSLGGILSVAGIVALAFTWPRPT